MNRIQLSYRANLRRIFMENIINNTLTIYHGGDEVITNPEIRIGKYTKDFYWGLAKFRYPTHQISFHTARALACLTYERSYNLR